VTDRQAQATGRDRPEPARPNRPAA